jgi:ferredoxin
MVKRKIIEIDRDKCNGCGLCTTACAEGALVLDEENKAVLAREVYCDGLGACLDVCPTGALEIVERESEDYSPEAAYNHVLSSRGSEAAEHVHGYNHPPASPCGPSGCPGSRMKVIERAAGGSGAETAPAQSELSQWPIQLHLVSPHAPYFQNADLLVAADCTAFSLGSFHKELLKGKKLIIACPKLDNTAGYIEKLSEILKLNRISSLTVATMIVPCCSGLNHIVDRAVESAGVEVSVNRVVINIDGSILGSS